MNWVAYTALIASVGLNVLFAVLIFTSTSRSAALLDRAHERTTKYTESLVDRIVSGDWQTYKAYTQGGLAVVEDSEDEDEPEVVPVLGPDRGGFGSRLGLAGWAGNNEEETIEALEREVT